MTIQFEKEWEWRPNGTPSAAWVSESLVWRGIVLATLEGSGDRWFGNFGDGRYIEDWKNRVAHIKSHEEVRSKIIGNLLRRLAEGMQGV